MTVYKVKKRTGAIVTFDVIKIMAALQKAFSATSELGAENISVLVEEIMLRLEGRFTDVIPDVEDIQDIVEAVLIH